MFEGCSLTIGTGGRKRVGNVMRAITVALSIPA
jgi:hypothetical protein